MNAGLLSSLRCPSCGSGLKVQNIFLKRSNRLVNAEVSCACGDYPILDGILFFAKGKAKKLAFDYLRRAKPRNEGLPFFFLRFPSRWSYLLLSLFSRVNFFSSFSFPFFIRLFILLGVYKKGWGRYQLGREKDRSFLPAKHFSKLVKKNAKVLDAGCGHGAFLSTLGKRTNAKNITATDTSLPGLYLAKRYFAPRANFIYLNLNDKLPFKDEYFDYVFCNDAFHYIKQQKRLAGELSRIISNKGSVVLTNLHNKYYSREFKGQNDYPQTPEGYISLFGQTGHILFSEHPVMKISTNKAKKLKKFTLVYSLSSHFQRLYSSTSQE